ncbi:MAG: LuxR C-terminal-related transcriptional regulator [Cellulomonadaceae bacterium]|jgi:DNA-binding CsgD family transcriptional regulator|nr:LuxR C-terminal-related transcriptional regulator [Cellulomonadaceae bacterium]
MNHNRDSSPGAMASVYNAVVDLGSCNALAIAQSLGQLDLTDIEEHLTRLVAIGLIHPSTVAPGSFRASAPESAFPFALNSLLERISADVGVLQSAAARTIVDYSTRGHREPNDTPDLGINTISGILARATKTADCILPAIPKPEMLQAGLTEDTLVMKRGVRFRFLYPSEAQEDTGVAQYATGIQGHSSEIRTHVFTPVHLVIADGQNAYLGVPTTTGQSIREVHSSPGIVQTLSVVFERLWQESQPLTNPKDPDPSHLSDYERRVIDGLHHGLSVDEIASANHLSASTVNRTIGALEKRVGTRSRFLLALEATRRGWLNAQ